MTNTLKIAPLKRIYLKAGKFSLITDQNREEINIAIKTPHYHQQLQQYSIY